MRIFVFIPTDVVGRAVTQDCLEALEELGHKIYYIDLKVIKDSINDNIRILVETLRQSKPDLIFVINRFGVVPKVLTRMKIPFACWLIDDPLLSAKKDYLSSYGVTFVCEKSWIAPLEDFGFERVYYLPMASNPRIFKEIELSDEDIEKYGCNLSFAGCSNYGINFQGGLFEGKIKDPETKAIIDQIIDIKSRNPSVDTSEILRDVQNDCGQFLSFRNSQEERKWVKLWIEPKAMGYYRKRLLEDISDLGLHLYGGGWSGAIDKKKVRLFGWIDYRTELPKLYNASKINLNITWAETALNMRVFDISCCGAFILTDYKSELENMFELEREVVCYRDYKDLRERIRYYLCHPEERREIARRARERVLSEHTYLHRMKDLIEIVKDISGDL